MGEPSRAGLCRPPVCVLALPSQEMLAGMLAFPLTLLAKRSGIVTSPRHMTRDRGEGGLGLASHSGDGAFHSTVSPHGALGQDWEPDPTPLSWGVCGPHGFKSPGRR